MPPITPRQAIGMPVPPCALDRKSPIAPSTMAVMLNGIARTMRRSPVLPTTESNPIRDKRQDQGNDCDGARGIGGRVGLSRSRFAHYQLLASLGSWFPLDKAPTHLANSG